LAFADYNNPSLSLAQRVGAAPTNTTLGAAGDPTAYVAQGPGTGQASDPLNPFPYEGNYASAANPPNPLGDQSGGITGFLGKNAGLLSLLGLGVGGQILGPKISSALGLNTVPGSENLTNLANQEGKLAQAQRQFGTAAEQPLLTGQLPPGQQQAVTNALNDAIATIKGRYASLGLSGSSMEAQAIADAQNRSTEVAGQLEQQMATTGANAISAAANLFGAENTIYSALMQAQVAQDEQLGNAISNFASAVGGGTALGSAIGAAKAA
jgi:hypothetical protein